jgi:hypothetical protein
MKSFCILLALLAGGVASATEVSGHVTLLRRGVSVDASNVVVRVVESPVAFATNRATKPVLRLTGGRFTEPLVFVVLVNEPFEIHNTSGSLYNLHLNFKGNTSRNIAVLAATDGKPKTNVQPAFARAEMYGRIADDLQQVSGMICVVENTGYTLSSNSGDYRLDLQPGAYTLEVALPGFAAARKQITVGQKPVKLDFAVGK